MAGVAPAQGAAPTAPARLTVGPASTTITASPVPPASATEQLRWELPRDSPVVKSLTFISFSIPPAPALAEIEAIQLVGVSLAATNFLNLRIDTNGDLNVWVHKYIKSRKAHCTNTFLTHKRAWLPNSPHGSLPAPFANTNTYKHVRCTNECPSCPAARARLEKPEIDCRHAMVHERAQKRAHAKASLCLSR